jgi:hypothetical protein
MPKAKNKPRNNHIIVRKAKSFHRPPETDFPDKTISSEVSVSFPLDLSLLDFLLPRVFPPLSLGFTTFFVFLSFFPFFFPKNPLLALSSSSFSSSNYTKEEEEEEEEFSSSIILSKYLHARRRSVLHWLYLSEDLFSIGLEDTALARFFQTSL